MTLNGRWRRGAALLFLASTTLVLLALLQSSTGDQARPGVAPFPTAPVASPPTLPPVETEPEEEVVLTGSATEGGADRGDAASPLVLTLPLDYTLDDPSPPPTEAVRLRTADGRACSIVSSDTSTGAVGRLRLDASANGGDLVSIDLDPSTEQRSVTSATFPTGSRSPKAHVLIAHQPDAVTEVTCDDLVTAARLAARMRIDPA